MTNNTYMLNFKPLELSWEKVNGLMPVIVQNYRSGLVLMQGFMNLEALNKTLELGKVTFFSRTKNRLWTKGEESRHYLNLKAITTDCDKDCLLIAADPIGPTCHRGTTSCFDGHMPLETANIALFNGDKNQDPEVLLKAFSSYKANPTEESGALLLKALLNDFSKNNIKLAQIDKIFAQNAGK